MATVRRNLRTGYPIWAGRRGAPTVAHEPLERDIKTDVLVIGAGITGAMVADALATAGVDVTVVDRRGLAEGSSVASTALVQHEIDTPLITLTRKIGKANAVRAWRRSRLAVDALAARFSDLELTDLTPCSSLYLAGNVLNRDQLQREHEARRAAGLPSRFLDRKSLRDEFRVARTAALVSHGNLTIDPRQATLALLQAAAAKGAALFAPADVVNVAPQKTGVIATVDNGHRIRCRHLVFATGYELPHGVPRRHHRINSTWAIATVPQRRDALWPDECCIWEAADPYLYLRTTPEGRVICGGGDQDFSDDKRRDALIGRKTAMLRRKLHRMFPRLDTTVEFAWAGAFGETTTGLPIIGPVPGMAHCQVALGYGGNGTTYAAIAADVIAGAIVGRPDVDADLYNFPGHDTAK